MSLLLKYIVFLFLTFNICVSDAAEVILELDETETEELSVPSIGAGNLPQPAQFRAILEREDNSPLGRLFLLGQYFEARYPDDALNVDFREDVAVIFPEMNEKEIHKTTGYIKAGIRLYRLSKEKIDEVKKNKLAPKDPPLVVQDDEYALLGDKEFIETKDGEVAIISDFKKIVGYGNNPKEIEAMEAFVERLRSQNKKQTDYEHFISMLKKLDWHDLTSYGVTRPSPFVGTAGIGDFIENEDFNARLISDTARIGDSENMILGLHMIVPNHRFMLATGLNNELQKPKIELLSSLNVAKAEVMFPLPLQAISSEMVGVYRGDFAFPIKITLQEKNKPAYFKFQITFLSCDAAFDCQSIVITPELTVDAKDEGKAVRSSMSNFIHQSFYNLPKPEHKDLVLENISYTSAGENEMPKFNFDFKYNGKIKNFAFFIENEMGTVFKTPEVIIGKNHIYVQTKPLQNTLDLLEKPLTLRVRLNDFVAIKQKVLPNNLSENVRHQTIIFLFFLGVFCGLLFYLTPFGFPLSYMSFLIKNNFNVLLKFIVSKTLFLCIFLIMFVLAVTKNSALLYALFAPDVFALGFCFFILFAFLLYLKKRLYEKMTYPLVLGGIIGVCSLVLFCVCGVPFAEKLLSAFERQSLYTRFVVSFGLVIGLMLPDMGAFYLKKRKINTKIFEMLMILAKFVICLAVIILVIRLFLPLSFNSLLFVLGEIFVALVILYFFFAFWEALYRTDLQPSYIMGTEKVLMLMLLGIIFGFATLIEKSSTLKENQSTDFNLEDVSARAQKGEKLIVAFEYPSCLVCKYNRVAVFNKSLIQKLKEDYQLSWLLQNIEKPNAVTIDFLQKYKRFSRPLYVLYAPMVPNGVVLPDLLDISELEDIFEMFRIYPSSSKSEAEKRRKTNLR